MIQKSVLEISWMLELVLEIVVDLLFLLRKQMITYVSYIRVC